MRAFKGGAWVTQGVGTVNGASSASPTFRGSLNFDQTKEAEAPSIDFAGAGRTVPWTTWYEDNTAPFGREEIFASRFDQTTQKWVFAGQGRPGNGGPPSLNIDVTKNAENPQVAGGASRGGRQPGPVDRRGRSRARPRTRSSWSSRSGPARSPVPPGTKPTGGAPVGGFCWQQVGVERAPVGAPTLPSVNVDPSRNGIEPDIAFTGPSRHRAVGGLVRDRPRGVRREERARLRGQGREHRHRVRGGRRRLPLGRGGQGHRRRSGARHVRDRRGAVPRVEGHREPLHAQPQLRGRTPRTRAWRRGR